MGIVAALGGVAAFFGLSGKWRRHEPEHRASELNPVE